MDTRFWQDKWERNEIAFHEKEGSLLLLRHFGKLNLQQQSRIFLPLCGKTKDIAWLLSKGHKVVGVELSELAISQLFQDLKIEATISKHDKLTHYSAKHIDIFVGDIFDLSEEILGPVDAIFDRGALVALPSETRVRYTRLLNELTKVAPQLLITLEYEEGLIQGPPFSIGQKEIEQHYDWTHDIMLVERATINNLRGQVEATETAWLLR
ncbi:thiopurine S-methyltransferase [Puniceicoccaceae bacterium K14]|nr:thiopurine S-methyltransferase [Puniceicoccaceae bacterium K14]